MKIRSSFVANSSSSSFIIGVKNIENFDMSGLPSWASKLLNKTINMITRDGTKFTSKEKLDKYFLYTYGSGDDTIESLLEEDSWVKEYYPKYLKAIESGFVIYDVDVDSNDESGKELFSALSTEDDGSGIYLIRNDC